MNTNDNYIQAIRDCVSCGNEVSPRGLKTYEVLAHTVQFDMNCPVITIPERGLDYNFMAAEAYWILSGSNKLDDFVRKNLQKYSDDGETMFGAYGPPFVDQIHYVVSKLLDDNSSRQAVITLWQQKPSPSKDIPCTVAMQFIIRDGIIHTNVFMRSQDVWLGLPYGIFSFSMMTLAITSCLQDTDSGDYRLGTLSIHAGSRHLYDTHLEVSQDLAATYDNVENFNINIHRLIHPGDLMIALNILRNAPSDIVLSEFKRLLC